MDRNKVFPSKPDALLNLFPEKKPVIGTIHLKPLPGSPHYRGEGINQVLEAAMEDSERYKSGGVDGLIVENGWDLPFAKPEDIGYETVSSMTFIAGEVIREFQLPTGINCLANAVVPSLAIAMAVGGKFIRSNQWVNAYVANEGLIEGASAKALRYRAKIRADEIKIFADVHVKHGSHSIVADRSLADQTRDAIFFDADVLIATGNRTGDATPVSEVTGIEKHSPLPVIVGSGLNDQNVQELFKVADGAIVGTFFKEDGKWWNPVDVDRVKRLMDQVGKFR